MSAPDAQASEPAWLENYALEMAHAHPQPLAQASEGAVGEVENPPAFPTIGNVAYASEWDTEHGMTLRDWFAGQAMAAIIAKIPFEEYPADFSPYEKTAIGAYDYADAMLRARLPAAAVAAVEGEG